MEKDINILNKTTEQIFNELTANMDTRSRYGYIKYMHDIIFTGGNSLWNIMRFLYVILAVYSPTKPVVDTQDMHDMFSALQNIGPNNPEYKKIPKYLHGVLNKYMGTSYRHPHDKEYIVKPARGKSKQFMAQYLKVYEFLRSFDRFLPMCDMNQTTIDTKLNAIVSELYCEVLKLVSMTTVCAAPKRKDVKNSGSLQMLQEYNLYASFGTVARSAATRRKITESRKSKNEKTRQFLRDMNAQELRRLSLRHDAELKTISNFDEFQKTLRRHEQERLELLNKQHTRIREFEKTFAKSKQHEIQDRNSERLNAQMKIARVTRMR